MGVLFFATLSKINYMTGENFNELYKQYVDQIAPKAPIGKSLIWAFLIGGLISVIGQGFYFLFDHITDQPREVVAGLVAVTLIGLAAILTGLGIYDRIGKLAGAAAAVPITGFSNAMTASAIEHRKEGIIFGTCSNMFKITGPVIVIGLVMSKLVGLIYWLISVI